MTMMAMLLTLGFGTAFAQGLWPDYDFRAVNPDGDTLYYRITSSTAPYTVAVTRCHDSVYHTLPWPQYAYEVGQPGFLYPVYDYDSLITVPSTVIYEGETYTVTAIDKEAFYMQKSMHTVILPTTVETVDSGAFCGSSLQNIVMPNVKHINYYAFENTRSLSHADLPSCLTYLGDMAFLGSALTEVDIPAGVAVLPYMAFWNCPLTKITLHEGLQVIKQMAFSPEQIDSLVFPGSLREIAALNAGFVYTDDTNYCRYVEFLGGTDPLELGDNCFLGFTHLETLILSDNITRIGEHCFELAGMQQVVIPSLIDTIPDRCFSGCSNLRNVVLPSQLTTIDKFAFNSTPMLTHITIPASVTFIGRGAFQSGSGQGLQVLDIYCEVPPTLEGSSPYFAFDKQDTVYVHVPCGMTTAYQNAPGWNSYDNFIYEECVGVEERELAEFKIYPNPADEVLYVELSGAGVQSVVLYDLQGRAITGVCDTPQQGITAINVRNVPAGVYILRVTDANGREHHQKVVVK
jgi:hypothetical protein